MYTFEIVVCFLAFTMWDGASASVGCGVQGDAYSPRLPSTKKRVINGQIAKAHSWPWIVIQEKNGNIFCGGTLIRVSDNLEESDIVLTAAHCVGVGKTDDPSNYDGWTVTAGKQVRTQTESGQQKRKVIKAVYNSDYVPVKNDIALVKLESSIKFSDTIRPACFPKQGDPTPVGKQCVVAGWGRTDSDDQYTPADQLQQAVEPVHDGSVCQKPWGGSFMDAGMVCVGVLDGTSGTCNGDSGGPLVCQDDDHWTQYGVMSYVGGRGRCVAPGWPSVFTKVSNYMDWVDNQVRELSSLVKKQGS